MNTSQAITTKYLPCTNTKGSRIQAKTASGIKVTISYPYELSGVDCHALAAETLAKQLGWLESGTVFEHQYAAGGTSTGYVFVNKL
jgi:hypothetical protein